MRLGELIEQLEAVLDKTENVWIEPFNLVPTDFESYRGYYYELSLAYELDSRCTVQELLDNAKRCIGVEFTGYKGGEFIMDESTPIWISNYGRVTNQKLSRIDVTGWGVYLHTRSED